MLLMRDTRSGAGRWVWRATSPPLIPSRTRASMNFWVTSSPHRQSLGMTKPTVVAAVAAADGARRSARARRSWTVRLMASPPLRDEGGGFGQLLVVGRARPVVEVGEGDSRGDRPAAAEV